MHKLFEENSKIYVHKTEGCIVETGMYIDYPAPGIMRSQRYIKYKHKGKRHLGYGIDKKQYRYVGKL